MSNQYDFGPEPEAFIRFKRIIRWALICASIAFILAAIVILCSCGESKSKMEIEGAWNSKTYPANDYLFFDEILVIRTSIAGTEIVEKVFSYEYDPGSCAIEIRDRDGIYFSGKFKFVNQDLATMEDTGTLKITLKRW